MARITTEKGKCSEYRFLGPNRNLSIIFSLFFSPTVGSSTRRYLSAGEHSIRFYKDEVEICKHSHIRNKFRSYRYEDIIHIKKGLKLHLLPLLLLLFFIILGIYWIDGIVIPLCFLIAPFCLGRCLSIKLKNHWTIKMPYYPMDYDEMIGKIVGTSKK